MKTGTVTSYLSSADGGLGEDGLEKRILMETCWLQGSEGTL